MIMLKIIWKNPWHGSRFFTPMARQKLHPLILCLDVQLQLCHAVSTESDIIDMTCCFQSPMTTCCDLVLHILYLRLQYMIFLDNLHIGLAHMVSKWFWSLSIAEVLISVLFLIKLMQFCHVLSRNGYPQFEKPYDPENSPTGLSSWGSRHHVNF